MKKIALAAGLAVLGAAAATPAIAADPQDRTPEFRSYLQFQFGGATPALDSLHYGLRIDHDSRLADRPMPAIAQLDFGARGFSTASVNGLPFVRSLSLQQNDGYEETRWTAIDWGLLAAGVAGLGFIVYEVSDSNDTSSDP
jgi:opacity protein-like surface antigen